MAKKKFKAPNLSNATPGFLADELGALRDKIKDLQKLEGFYKEALLGKVRRKNTQTGEFKGDKYTAVITQETQFRIDTTGLKKEFGEDWYTEHCMELSFSKVSVKPNPDEDKPKTKKKPKK